MAKLTKDQIEDFQEQEKDLEDVSDFIYLAEEIFDQ